MSNPRARSYRFVALALVLGFVLGAALPEVCRGGASMPASHGHQQAPCTGPCHAAEASPQDAPALLLEAHRRLVDASGDYAGRAQLGALLLPALLAPLSPPRATVPLKAGPRRTGLPPVRLHVFHAVFLN